MTRETAGQVSSHKTLRTPERRKDQNILYRARRATRTIFYLVPASHSLQGGSQLPAPFISQRGPRRKDTEAREVTQPPKATQKANGSTMI